MEVTRNDTLGEVREVSSKKHQIRGVWYSLETRQWRERIKLGGKLKI